MAKNITKRQTEAIVGIVLTCIADNCLERIMPSNHGTVHLAMKRTVPLLMMVLMLVILDGGNAKSGLAQTVDDCPYDISGTSGRRVCEDTEIEFWDWTAPATGPVTFDTRGSDESLELTVYTFGPYTEVAAALNEVRFTAQQGVEYTIFAQSPDEQAGTIVLNWRAGSSCGNGGTSPVGSSDQTGLREDDTVTQSRYVSTDGSVSVRTFHDVDGLPHKVLNECSGDWMLIQRYDAANVDFWFYDADGNYQSGLAVFEDEGSYYYAEIDGVPVHAGKQITGSLRPTGTSWTGSYALEVDMSEIQDPQPVPDEIAALINGLSSDGTGRRGMVPGRQSRFAALLGPLGTWLLPGVAVAQPAVTVQDVLSWAGIIMVGAGTAGLAAPVYATAGAVTFFASYLAPHVSQETIRSRCPDSPKMAHDLCHMIADNLADPGERGLTGFVSDFARDPRGTLSRGAKKLLSGIGQLFNSPRPPQAKAEPIRLIPDDTPPETVTGTMTDGTTTVDVTGTVTSDGDFEVADGSGEVRLELSVNASRIEGSFEWDGVTGDAEVDPLSNDWEIPNNADATADDQAAAESAMREAEEARRLAERAATESGGTSAADDDGETLDDEQTELEALLAALEATRREAEDAERLTRQESGTSVDGDDTDDSGSLPPTSTPGQTTQYSTTVVCWNYAGPFTNCIERQFTTERDARWECGLYTPDRQGAGSCPGSYKGRPLKITCTTTTDKGRTTDTLYKYYKSASCD